MLEQYESHKLINLFGYWYIYILYWKILHFGLLRRENGRLPQAFLWNVLPPYWRSKTKPNKQNKYQSFLVWLTASWRWTLVLRSSEVSINFYHTTRHHFPHNIILFIITAVIVPSFTVTLQFISNSVEGSLIPEKALLDLNPIHLMEFRTGGSILTLVGLLLLPSSWD